MNKYILILACIVSVFVFSCSDPEPDPVTYTNAVKQIIDTNCATANCHGEGTDATFEMHNYEKVVEAVSFGKIIESINHDDSNGVLAMPFGADKLAQEDIDAITTWINEGTAE